MGVGPPLVPAGKTSLESLRLSGGFIDHQFNGQNQPTLASEALPGLAGSWVLPGDTASPFPEALASGPKGGVPPQAPEVAPLFT